MSHRRPYIEIIRRKVTRQNLVIDRVGGVTIQGAGTAGFIEAYPVVASASGSLMALIKNVRVAAGNMRLGIYADNGNTPVGGALLAQSASTAVVGGFNILIVTGVSIVTGTKYWVAYQLSSNSCISDYINGGAQFYAAYAYGVFPETFPAATLTPYTKNVGIIYQP